MDRLPVCRIGQFNITPSTSGFRRMPNPSGSPLSDSPLTNGGAYLKPNVKVEPLVCGWHAWIHLISPAQHAMNVAFRHLPLLQSFLKNPAVHAAAATDRSLFGGPFVCLPPDRAPEVQQLLKETEIRCAKLLTFARDLKQFDR